MRQWNKLMIATVALLSSLGCSTIQSKHQPQFSKNDWIDDITPFHPQQANEWSTIDLGKPHDGEAVFRYDPESPIQDLLDLM